jgi:putative ABC transport system permease protein
MVWRSRASRCQPGTQQPQARFYVVSPGYFETLRIPVREGREPNACGRRDAPKVVVVNRRFAQLHFRRRPALGRRVQSGSDDCARSSASSTT